MNTNKAYRFVAGFALCLLLLGSIAAFAGNNAALSFVEARPIVNISLAGNVERGDQKVSLDKVDTVKPGEIIHWTVISENKGDADAKELKSVGKIPEGTVYVANSAKAESAKVLYSIDGGKTFSAHPMIKEKQTDGSIKEVPAPVNLYTHIRFDYQTALNGNASLTASYDVKVK